MSERRRDAATATVGLAGVGGAAALRHEALVRSHRERYDPWTDFQDPKWKPPVPRKKVFAERRLLKHPQGRKTWLAGAALGAVSLPAAATGVHGVLHPKKVTAAKRDRGFWSEGLAGAKDAAINRTQTAQEKAPPKLVLGNYAAGAAVGSATGGLAHLALKKRPIGGHGKAALASVAGTTVGTAMLPLQSRLTARASRGKYEVTPTGVRRVKKAPRRASSKATVIDGRGMDPRAFRSQTVGKALRVKVIHDPPLPKLPKRQAPAGSYHWHPLSRKARQRRTEQDWKAIRAHHDAREADGKGPVSQADIRAAYKAAGYKNSAGRPRKLHREELQDAQDSTGSRTGVGIGSYALGSLPRQDAYRVSKMTPRQAVRSVREAHNTAGAKIGAHWTVQGLRAADKLDVPNRALIPKTKTGKLVYTGRTKVSALVRQAALDVGSINDKDAMARSAIHGHPLIGKRDDPGGGMSRGERRARIAASGPPIPVVGDIIQARTAGRLSPEKYRRRTGAQTFSAGQAGGYTGNAVGAGVALGAARISPKFDAKAKGANDWIDAKKLGVRNKIRASVGKDPIAPGGKGLLERAAEHHRTPVQARRAYHAVKASPVGRAVAHNPKVAAIGALVGGSIGAPTAQQAMLSHTLRRDDRYRASIRKSVGLDKPGPTPVPLSRREQEKLRRRKNTSAAMSVLGGTTGLSALGATLGSAALKKRPALAARIPRTTKAMKDVQVPLLTAGAGIGGFNSFNYAGIQHKEASQVRKALLAPRVPGIRRAPAMRKGFLRQTRYPSGMVRTSTVRGGLA